MILPAAFVALALGQAPPLPSQVMAEISADRLIADVATLANFGTRHTLSDTTSETRGIGAARRWLKAQFEKASPNLQVSFEEFDAPKGPRLPDGARVVNVVAVLPGTTTPNRAYYVVGHYDSRNGEAMDAQGDSPGANDDASGTAALLEIARVLAPRPLESTIIFLCTAGEEQGLVGAQYHAAEAAAHKRFEILGVLNNDIIGDNAPTAAARAASAWGARPIAELEASVRVFSEGVARNPSAKEHAELRAISGEYDSPSRQLARFIAEVSWKEHAAIRPMLVMRPDRFLRGGDHSTFNEKGFAAVRFTCVHEDYSRQHQNVTDEKQPDGTTLPYGDVTRFVQKDYLAGVTRLNAAALVHLANAPAPPKDVRIITKELMNETTIRWSRSPEQDTKGYAIVWRSTGETNWTHSRELGDVAEITVPLSKDDYFFGIRAYDRDGYASPVVFAAAAKE